MGIVNHRRFSQSFPPPPLGSNQVHSFSSQLDIPFSTDGGRTFTLFSASADVTVAIHHVLDVGGTEYYDTEMLALSSKITRPDGSMFFARESPSRASLGQTTLRRLGAGAGGPIGGYAIGSFFDIWTELSFDGSNWIASSTPVRVELERECEPLLAAGGPWRYLDNGTDQGTAWPAITFNDATWNSGPAELGFGDGDEMTVVARTNAAGTTNITFYFRQYLNIANASLVNNLTVRLKRDDAGIVYLNGVEILRDNLPAGLVTFSTPALAAEPNETATPGSTPPSAPPCSSTAPMSSPWKSTRTPSPAAT